MTDHLLWAIFCFGIIVGGALYSWLEAELLVYYRQRPQIFLIAYFKYPGSAGFKRCNLITFYTTLSEAQYHAMHYFCDEAGYYNGVLIEERQSGNEMFHGQRFWYEQKSDGQIELMPEPDEFSDTVNLI